MLAAVENAPPVAAADVMGQLLAAAMDASAVAFLIADFSGDALIRLSHDDTRPTSSPDRDVAERVSLGGSRHDRVLAERAVQVDSHAGLERVRIAEFGTYLGTRVRAEQGETPIGKALGSAQVLRDRRANTLSHTVPVPSARTGDATVLISAH